MTALHVPTITIVESVEKMSVVEPLQYLELANRFLHLVDLAAAHQLY